MKTLFPHAILIPLSNKIPKRRCLFPGCFSQDAGAGLLAAAMIAVVPGYISRSVAGSYDNEGEFVTLGETFKDWWVLESGAGRCCRAQELCPFLMIPAGFVLNKPDPSEMVFSHAVE